MEAESVSPSQKERRWRRWEWLLLLLALLTSFVCVFCSTNLALGWWEDNLTPASLLAQRRADYRLGPQDQVKFGFLDPNIVGQAATDRALLYITPVKGSPNSGTPVTIAWLPATPTRGPDSESRPPNIPGGSGPDSPPPVAGGTATPGSSPTSFASPTGTAQPTPTAAGTATPQPTMTPVASPTPAPTSTSQNVPTVAPTWTLAPPTPTAGPTSKPKSTDPPPATLPPPATVTATPTNTEIPTATPTPTDTPTVTPTPTDTATPGPYQNVKPILERVVDNGDGTCTGYFGYLNKNTYVVNIPVGSGNRFNPLPEDRGQPAVFNPGRVVDVVSVIFSGANQVWLLESGSATAGPTGSCLTYQITGQVRNDTAYNGGSGSDAGSCDSTMQGVTVNLYQSGLFQTTTTTNSACQYSFSALSAGTYTVEVDATTFNGLPGTMPEQTWESNTGGDALARGGEDPNVANDHRADVTVGPSATVNFSFSYNAVVNTLDGGQGSLRQAIDNANAIAGPNTVAFGLFGSGFHTIQPATELPNLNGDVTVDGTTQPGYVTGTPVIILDGFTGTGNLLYGLTLGHLNNNQVRGLMITRFENGLILGGDSNRVEENSIVNNTKNGIKIVNSLGNTIINNTTANNDFSGIRIAAGSDGQIIQGNNVTGNQISGISVYTSGTHIIGGSTLTARNIIATNRSGIYIENSSGNEIKGNYIGTNQAGDGAAGNSKHGIYFNNASGNFIGGSGAGEGNVISGNGEGGIYLETAANGNDIQGNYIGVGADGITAIGNGNLGIAILDSSNNTIGGTGSGAGNIIAYNVDDGVEIWENSGSSVQNAIHHNRIFNNGNIGIDLAKGFVTPNDSDDSDTGPNKLQNFPILNSASLGSGLTVTGTLTSTANTLFTIELFSNSAGDSRGHGEGEYYLDSFDVTTDGTGIAPFTYTYSGPVTGTFITATATDPDGNTSEFGPNVVP